MENNENSIDNWKPLKDRLKSIEEYYGIELGESVLSRIVNEIINELAASARRYMPNKFYANCVDGQVRQGLLSHTNFIEILALRSKYKSDKIGSEGYERLLLKTDELFTYCKDNNRLYNNINPLIGRYVMRHNLSENIIDLITGEIKITSSALQYGNIASVFDKYIKFDRNINVKKDLVSDTLLQDFSEKQIKNEYFPIFYFHKILHKEDVEKWNYLDLVDNDSKLSADVTKKCINADIPYYDTVRRINLGSSLDYAIQKGLEDKEKYGFIYDKEDTTVSYKTKNINMSICCNNYNFIKYIEYLAKQEERELGI